MSKQRNWDKNRKIHKLGTMLGKNGGGWGASLRGCQGGPPMLALEAKS